MISSQDPRGSFPLSRDCGLMSERITVISFLLSLTLGYDRSYFFQL